MRNLKKLGLVAGVAMAGLWATVNAAGSEVIEFDPTLGELPESVALDSKGNTYASMSVRVSVVRISPDGARQEFAIPHDGLPDGALGALGLTVGKHGSMYVAVQGCGPMRCSSSNGVWRIERNGRTSKLPGSEHIAFPNDVTLDSWGNVYVSDTASGAIWLIRRNYWRFNRQDFRPARIWIQDSLLLGTGFLMQFGQPIPLGVNGIVFSQEAGGRGEILVANTEQASILAIPIVGYGRAGEIQTVAGGLCADCPIGLRNPQLLTVDGIDVDRFGDIFAATAVQLGPAGPVPSSSVYHIKRRTGMVQLVHSGPPMNLTTDVALGKTFDGAKDIWFANPGFLAPNFMLPIEPSIARLPLENSWFEASIP